MGVGCVDVLLGVSSGMSNMLARLPPSCCFPSPVPCPAVSTRVCLCVCLCVCVCVCAGSALASSQTGGSLTISAGYGKGSGGHLLMNAGDATDSTGGSVVIRCVPHATRKHAHAHAHSDTHICRVVGGVQCIPSVLLSSSLTSRCLFAPRSTIY